MIPTDTEINLRCNALSQACCNSTVDSVPADIVAKAEAFYAFLNKSSEPMKAQEGV